MEDFAALRVALAELREAGLPFSLVLGVEDPRRLLTFGKRLQYGS